MTEAERIAQLQKELENVADPRPRLIHITKTKAQSICLTRMMRLSPDNFDPKFYLTISENSGLLRTAALDDKGNPLSGYDVRIQADTRTVTFIVCRADGTPLSHNTAAVTQGARPFLVRLETTPVEGQAGEEEAAALPSVEQHTALALLFVHPGDYQE